MSVFVNISIRSPDGAELAERNPGFAHEPRIPAFGLHPGYHCYRPDPPQAGLLIFR